MNSDPVSHRPRAAILVLLVAVALGALVFGWSLWETQRGSRALDELMSAEGAALAEALGHAVEDALQSEREIEELASSRLLDQARLLDRMDAARLLDPADLDELADGLGLHRIVILDARWNEVLAGGAPSESGASEGDRPYRMPLTPLVEGRADFVVLDPRPAPEGRGMRFAAAVRRARGGAVLVVMDAGEMLAFQEEIGADDLLEAVSGTGGILYAALEDADGGLLAGGVPESDANDEETLEITRPVRVAHRRLGNLRVGVSTRALSDARRAGRRRTTVLGFVLLALALAAYAAALARQRARLLEDRSRRAENLSALGRVAGSVAHEVRNPLNAIAVGVQRLAREFAPTERTADYNRLTGLLRGEIERLDGIVDRFLDLAREPALDPRASDLDALVRDTTPLLARGAPPGVEITDDLGGLPDAVFDPTALRQVVVNLVRNAVEAIGERGTVRIRTRVADGGAVLEIIDDGPGIPARDRARLFEFGFTTKAGGTGMGLSIVHRLVAGMGGSVAVDSAPGAGTAVRIRLPLASDPSSRG